MAEERISELWDIAIESLKTEKQREQRLKRKGKNIQGLWDNYKWCNIHVMDISEEGQREKGTERKYLKQ